MASNDDHFGRGWWYGLGFWSAASVVALVWIDIGVIALSAMTQELRTFRAAAPRLETQPKDDKRQVVTVPPKSRDECLQASGGIANEEYARCRTGYTELR